MCNVGLICGFSQSTTGARILQLERNEKHVFLHLGVSGRQVEGNSREEALTSSSPYPSWAQKEEMTQLKQEALQDDQ